MAQVTHSTTAKIDWLLDYLFDQWEDVREIAAEWESLEFHEREDFWAEWPLKEDAQLRLEHFVERDLLSPAQCERYSRLRDVMGELRPTVEWMLKNVATPTSAG